MKGTLWTLTIQVDRGILHVGPAKSWTALVPGKALRVAMPNYILPCHLVLWILIWQSNMFIIRFSRCYGNCLSLGRTSIQGNYNTPGNGNPPATPTMKGTPKHRLLVKVAKGVCSSSVCWNNLRINALNFQIIGFALTPGFFSWSTYPP